MEAATCLAQVVHVRVCHHVHDNSLQRDLGIICRPKRGTKSEATNDNEQGGGRAIKSVLPGNSFR